MYVPLKFNGKNWTSDGKQEEKVDGDILLLSDYFYYTVTSSFSTTTTNNAVSTTQGKYLFSLSSIFIYLYYIYYYIKWGPAETRTVCFIRPRRPPYF